MSYPWPLLFAALLFGLIGWVNFITGPDGRQSGLAESFLAGKLHLLSQPPTGWGDTAPFAGYRYWPGGPLPAVLSMPLVWSGYYHQGVVAFFVSLLVFYLCYQLARKCDYRSDEACWFALAFCFATSYIGVAALAGSSAFAHLVAVAMLFLALNEYQGRSRLWLTGGLIGLAMASRAPAGINILVFCFGNSAWRRRRAPANCRLVSAAIAICRRSCAVGDLQLGPIRQSSRVRLYLSGQWL